MVGWGQGQAQSQPNTATGINPALTAGKPLWPPTPVEAIDSAPRMGEAELKARYQNCPGGWYAGPRPGKARFTQDPWLWVVTPEFAQRFCMPQEFVSTELKGAEAVAFRLATNTDEVNCGFGNNALACAGQVALRFEVYIKRDVKLPKASGATYFQRSRLPSTMLMGTSPQEWQARARFHQSSRPEALTLPFSGQQVALQGVRNGVVEWPITALYVDTHFAAVFDGIDYYAFEGRSGDFANSRMLREGISDFQIMFEHLATAQARRESKQVSEYAHTISLPKAYAAEVQRIDLTQGVNFSAELRRAFGR